MLLRVAYLSKSMSYRVSWNGSSTGSHILDAADASDGIPAIPPVTVAREASAAAELVYREIYGGTRQCKLLRW